MDKRTIDLAYMIGDRIAGEREYVSEAIAVDALNREGLPTGAAQVIAVFNGFKDARGSGDD